METRLVYDLMGAPSAHPQTVMKSLAEKEGFRVIGAVPQSIADQWWFWIEAEGEPALPAYVRKASWLPVGST